MTVARGVREIETSPGVLVTRAKDRVLPDTPIVGTLVQIAREPDDLLEVAAVTMRAHPAHVYTLRRPAIDVFLIYHGAETLEPARAHPDYQDGTSQHRTSLTSVWP